MPCFFPACMLTKAFFLQHVGTQTMADKLKNKNTFGIFASILDYHISKQHLHIESMNVNTVHTTMTTMHNEVWTFDRPS